MSTFILRHVTSAAQLEVLLLLHRRSGETLANDAVAKELRIHVNHADEMLVRLAQDGLLRRVDDSYGYAPGTKDLADAVDTLADLYPRYRVAIVSLIFSARTERIRDFSDAFRFRRED